MSDVSFPKSVAYYAAADDVPGDKAKGLLRLRRGALLAIYKADDTNWWLGKVGDEVGWVPAAAVAPLDLNAAGRRQHVRDRSPEREWVQAESVAAAAEMDMDKTDFSLTQAKTFELQGSRITAYFVQVSCVRKGVEGRGDMWVVAKTLKAFNRLRVAWEEDYGANTMPVEPPPARWADCSPQEWDTLRHAGLTAFLNEVKHRPSLRTSQDLRHFLTTDRLNLTGGMVTERAMKPFLDAWLKTSSEPGWTQTLPEFPGERKPLPLATPAAPAAAATAAPAPPLPGRLPGLQPQAGGVPLPPPPGGAGAAAGAAGGSEAAAAGGPSGKRGVVIVLPPEVPADDGFGKMRGTRPKVRRSAVFAQISALAAVTKQEASLTEFGRRGWIDSVVKLHLLTAGGQASGCKRKSERSVYTKYFKGSEQDGDGGGVLNNRGSFNAMKLDTRFNLEKIMYGRMEDMRKEPNAKYAEYARNKGLVGAAGGGGGGADAAKARGLPSPVTHRQRKLQQQQQQQQSHGRSGSVGGGPGHQKKNTMFVLDALAERLERIQKINDIQSADETATRDACQYMSRVKGRLSMPLPAQLMALEELSPEALDLLLLQLAPSASGSKIAQAGAPKGRLERMKALDTALADVRVRCHQVLALLQALKDPQERLLVVVTCCARLTDAVEAEDHKLWEAVAGALGKQDDLNLQRARLIAQQLATEAHAEEASRKSRAAARDVHVDVQRARKGLNFLSKAVENVRLGAIKSNKFAQLKERLETAADAAKEEARDAIEDAKPIKDLAEEALRLVQQAEKANEDLDELGSAPHERRKATPPEGDLTEPEACLLVIQEALEVLLTMSDNACELTSRAAENARFDMQSALDEVTKAEKMMRRVELEERRARNECDAVEGKASELEVPEDCPFAAWAPEMKEVRQQNLKKFVKDGQYRPHVTHRALTGTEDEIMMVCLLAKVPLIRDLTALKADAAAAAARRESEAMGPIAGGRGKVMRLAAAAARRRGAAGAGGGGATAAGVMRGVQRRSSVGPAVGVGGGDGAAGKRVSVGRGVSRRSSTGTGMGSSPSQSPGVSISPPLRSESTSLSPPAPRRQSVGASDADAAAAEGGGSDSEEDSVFGSDLDGGDDDDLAALRRGVTSRRSRSPRRGRRAGGGKGDGGADASPVPLEGMRRNEQLRKQLIKDTLGQRKSIGRVALAQQIGADLATPAGADAAAALMTGRAGFREGSDSGADEEDGGEGDMKEEDEDEEGSGGSGDDGEAGSAAAVNGTPARKLAGAGAGGKDAENG